MENNKKLMTVELETLLTNSYSVYLKLQNYHWNITGAQFITLHKLFEEQYLDLSEAVDQIAERIRMLGSKVAVTLSALHKNTTIKDPNENHSAEVMLQELLADHQVLIENCKNSLDVATKCGDTTTGDLLSARIAVHEKACWVISSLQG